MRDIIEELMDGKITTKELKGLFGNNKTINIDKYDIVLHYRKDCDYIWVTKNNTDWELGIDLFLAMLNKEKMKDEITSDFPTWKEIMDCSRKQINKIVYDKLEEITGLRGNTISIEDLENMIVTKVGLPKDNFLFIKFLFYLTEDLLTLQDEVFDYGQDWFERRDRIDDILYDLRIEYKTKYLNK